MTRVLLVGLPRSGTTWVERCLGRAARTRYVNEPDNENIHPFAVRAKRGLGRYPILGPDESGPPAYRRLWSTACAGGQPPTGLVERVNYRLYDGVRGRAHPEAIGGLGLKQRTRLAACVALAAPGRPTPSEHLVVKSVFLPFALEWVLASWPCQVVVIARDPLNTVASWWSLGWRDVLWHHPAFVGDSATVPPQLAARLDGAAIPVLPREASELARLTWQFGLLSSALVRSARRTDGCVVARHAELCVDPVPAFRSLFHRAGLPWSPAAEDYLLASNRPGEGAYDTTRVAATEADRWRERLSDQQADEVRDVLSGFDLDW